VKGTACAENPANHPAKPMKNTKALTRREPLTHRKVCLINDILKTYFFKMKKATNQNMVFSIDPPRRMTVHS
jgi:hypothetical protein